MSPDRLRELRRLYRQHNQIPSDLEEELRLQVRLLVGQRRLPPLYSPYGEWNQEAEHEVFQGWFATRLTGEKGLQRILDKAASPAALGRLLEQSLRGYLLNTKEKSEARHLFKRTDDRLKAEADFVSYGEVARRADQAWGLAGWGPREAFDGSPSDILAHAYALGDFTIVRLKPEAKKLSHTLDRDELKRFVRGLLERVGAPLTLAQMMDAMSERFDLGEAVYASLDEVENEVSTPPDTQFELKEAALAVIAELTERQLEVLAGTARDEEVKSMAARLNCSVGTIVNERRKVGQVISRLSENAEEERRTLNRVLDLVFEVTREK